MLTRSPSSAFGSARTELAFNNDHGTIVSPLTKALLFLGVLGEGGLGGSLQWFYCEELRE